MGTHAVMRYPPHARLKERGWLGAEKSLTVAVAVKSLSIASLTAIISKDMTPSPAELICSPVEASRSTSEPERIIISPCVQYNSIG